MLKNVFVYLKFYLLLLIILGIFIICVHAEDRKISLLSTGTLSLENTTPINISTPDLVKLADEMDKLEKTWFDKTILLLNSLGVYFDSAGNPSINLKENQNTTLPTFEQLQQGISFVSVSAKNEVLSKPLEIVSLQRGYNNFPSVFTAPNDGYLFLTSYINVQYWGNSNSMGYGCNIVVRKNGVAIYSGTSRAADSTSQYISLKKGDTVTLRYSYWCGWNNNPNIQGTEVSLGSVPGAYGGGTSFKTETWCFATVQ